MPKLANRNNAMPAVKPPPTEQVEPQKPSIAEKTADAFDKEVKPKQKVELDENRRIINEEDDMTVNKNIDMSISEIPPAQTLPTEPIDIPQKKKQKKPCSDKLKAHLARCREKSLAKRRANKTQAPIEKAQARASPPPQKPTEYKNVNQSQTIDYERIINGVSNSLYSRFGLEEPDMTPPPQKNEHMQRAAPQPQRSFHQPHAPPPQQQPPQKSQRELLIEYEKQIREDERKKVKAERQAELDRTFKSKGMQILKNGVPTHRTQGFKQEQVNPYANAFGRRKF